MESVPPKVCPSRAPGVRLGLWPPPRESGDRSVQRRGLSLGDGHWASARGAWLGQSIAGPAPALNSCPRLWEGRLHGDADLTGLDRLHSSAFDEVTGDRSDRDADRNSSGRVRGLTLAPGGSRAGAWRRCSTRSGCRETGLEGGGSQERRDRGEVLRQRWLWPGGLHSVSADMGPGYTRA